MYTHIDFEIIGVTPGTRIGDPDKFVQLIQKALQAGARQIYTDVQARLGAIDFKNSTGRIQRALRMEVGDGWAAVWMDERIAPHAPYIEKGVQRHTMRYLLKATRPIPIGVGNATVYRWATEKWMERPHPIVDPKSGLVSMTTGWVHPGYEGKFYFRDGTISAMGEVRKRLNRFVFRAMVSDSAMEETP